MGSKLEARYDAQDRRAIERQKAIEEAVFECFARLEDGEDRQSRGLVGLSINLQGRFGEILITLRGFGQEGAQVAFIGAGTITEAFAKLGKALDEGTLAWREDQFRKA